MDKSIEVLRIYSHRCISRRFSIKIVRNRVQNVAIVCDRFAILSHCSQNKVVTVIKHNRCKNPLVAYINSCTAKNHQCEFSANIWEKLNKIRIWHETAIKESLHLTNFKRMSIKLTAEFELAKWKTYITLWFESVKTEPINSNPNIFKYSDKYE